MVQWNLAIDYNVDWETSWHTTFLYMYITCVWVLHILALSRNSRNLQPWCLTQVEQTINVRKNFD